jgi:hypothetical protein
MPADALSLSALDALAQKATPGPWTHNKRGEIRWPGSKVCSLGIVAIVTDPTHPTAIADAAYIAAVSPEVVRRLIAALRQTRAALRRMREEFSQEAEEDYAFAPCGDSITFSEACNEADTALAGIVDEPEKEVSG